MAPLLFLLGILLLLFGLIGLIFGRLPKVKGRKIPLLLFLAGIILITVTASVADKEQKIAQEKAAQEQQRLAEAQAANQTLTEKLKKDLYENFGGAGNPNLKTSWYDDIKKVEARYRYQNNQKTNECNLYVWTPYYPDNEGKQAAKRLSGAFLSLFNDATKDYPKLHSITIYGQGERILYSGTAGIDYVTK